MQQQAYGGYGYGYPQQSPAMQPQQSPAMQAQQPQQSPAMQPMQAQQPMQQAYGGYGYTQQTPAMQQNYAQPAADSFVW